jgi:capsular exopolysaccharide synthesis family protein
MWLQAGVVLTIPHELGDFNRPPPALPHYPEGEPPSARIVDASPGEVVPIDLRQVLSILRRRLRLFVAVAVVIMAGVVAFTILSPQVYRATAEVMLNRRNPKITKVDDVLAALPADSAAVDTEIEILKSAQLAERVASSLRLDKDPEFNPPAKTSSSRKTPSARAVEIAVANRVRQNLNVTRSGLTYVIDLTFKSRDPAKAARIANEFGRLYIAQQVEGKVNATHEAASWLNDRLQELRGQVTADETAVQQFKIENGLMSAQGATLTEQEISAYNQSLAQASAQAAEDDARLQIARRQLARGSTGDDVGEALSSPTIQKLRDQRAEASRKVATLSTYFKDEYPDLKKARHELDDIDEAIREEIKRIISNLDAKAQVSRQRAAAIAGSVGTAKGELASNNRASVRLSELERNAGASRSLYENYLARYKETSSQEGLASADAQMVSLATPPTDPSSPDVRLNLLLGAALATVAGFGAVALAELLESGLATSADVGKRLNLRYLGAIPALKGRGRWESLAPIDYVVERPFSAFAEAFRSLLASIIHGQGPVKVVAVTSALPGEGKTTTAICLARAAALQGRRVVLVDCDLRRRSLNRIVPKSGDVGLMDVLVGQADLSQALVKDSRTNAEILPLGHGPITLTDVFGSRGMDRLLLQLRTRYDLVVLDTPPVLPVADARVLAQRADFVAVVTRWRVTPYKAVQGALGLLWDNNVEVGGILLNRVDMAKQVRHGYGDINYYYSSYKQYYLESPKTQVTTSASEID